MLKGIPTLGKFVAVTHVVEKYKVSGSIARVMLRACIKNGTLKQVLTHGKQFICAPTLAIAEKAVVEDKGKKAKGDKKDKK